MKKRNLIIDNENKNKNIKGQFIMNIQETVLNILEDITGTDEVVNNQDIQLFEEGLLDSLATVQLLVEIEGQLGIQVPVSDFDREVWGTPKQIIQQVEALQ